MVKDYLGHEINIGDTLMYNQKACKGYYSSFTEGVVVATEGVVVAFNKNKVEVCALGNLENYKKEQQSDWRWASNYTDRKFGDNTVNLTALGIREGVDI